MLNFIPLQEAQGGGYMSILMIVLLFVVFYFFMIRPQQQQQKKIRQFRESIGKGSKIITSGGIKGVVTDVKDTEFEVEIAKGVRVIVDRNTVYPSAADANADPQNQQK